MPIIRYLKTWLAPVACVLCLIIGFAIRGSDQPTWALLMGGVMAVLTAVVWCVQTPSRPVLENRRYALWPAGIFVVLCLSLWLLPVIKGLGLGGDGLYDPSAFVVEFLKLCAVGCAFACGYRLSLTDDAAKRLFDALLAAGAVWAMIAILMQVLDPEGIYGVVKHGPGRLSGAFSSPNSAATLFGALSVLALAQLIGRFIAHRSRNPVERIHPVYAAIFIVCLTALCLTLSRGGLIATLVAMACLCSALLWRRLSIAGVVGFAAAGLALFVGLLSTPMINAIQRATHIHADGVVRKSVFLAHLDIATRQPVLGAGLGSFISVNNTIITDANYADLATIRAAHNVYIQWFEETGALGLALLIAVNLLILIPIFLAARHRGRMGPRLWGILFAYAVFLLHGIADFAFQEMSLALFAAVFLGMGFAISGNRGGRAI